MKRFFKICLLILAFYIIAPFVVILIHAFRFILM